MASQKNQGSQQQNQNAGNKNQNQAGRQQGQQGGRDQQHNQQNPQRQVGYQDADKERKMGAQEVSPQHGFNQAIDEEEEDFSQSRNPQRAGRPESRP